MIHVSLIRLIDKKKTYDPVIKLFQPSVIFHIETTHLFCYVKQMTGFYMKCNTTLKWINEGLKCNWKVMISPAKTYLFKVSNRNTRKRCKICSKLIIKTLERRQYIVLLPWLLTLNIFHTFFDAILLPLLLTLNIFHSFFYYF